MAMVHFVHDRAGAIPTPDKLMDPSSIKRSIYYDMLAKTAKEAVLRCSHDPDCIGYVQRAAHMFVLLPRHSKCQVVTTSQAHLYSNKWPVFF